MKKTILVTVALSMSLFSQAPTFTDQGILPSVSQTDLFPCPAIADWNGDGNVDLLVGIFSGNSVKYYENTGTNENPSLTSAVYVKAGGSNISLSAN